MANKQDSIFMLTDVDLLRSATKQDFFVEKYGDKYSRMRKKARNLFRERLLELVNEVENGYIYRATEKGRTFVVDHDLKVEFKRVNRRAAINQAVEEAFE